MARLDPHSYADDAQPKVASFTWDAVVDFERRLIEAVIELTLHAPGEGPLDLDTRGLQIGAVRSADKAPLQYELGPEEPILGQRLRIQLPPGTQRLQIRYRTSDKATALQWLTAEQTADRRLPFLFSQCQAIHARSVLPLQDTPAVRVTYTARVTAPTLLRTVMAAAEGGERQRNGDMTTQAFLMPQPIPPYLFAFAVGALESRELGPRSKVWAERSVVEAAAWEFADTDKMIAAAEALFGPYDWDRFDLLTMPPSFPYGGMENPRLTFITPTLLAKDRSLVSVIAHELAHSWTGNLVTNANAEHFWLNEGFTVYAERRILEAIEGREVSELHAALGFRTLEQAVERAREHPELTRLRTQLQGVDPDEAFSQVPYEKGYLLLRALEEHVGRPRFDAFLRKYMASFRFQSLTTEQLVSFLDQELPGALRAVHGDDYLHAPGIPITAPRASSGRLLALRALGDELPTVEAAKAWSPTEWQLYLESLPRTTPPEKLRALDERFQLTRSQNSEVLVSWLQLAAHGRDPAVLEAAQRVLRAVGRMKYLKPLYSALAQSGQGALAREIFQRSRAGYHPIAQQVIESLLEKTGA